MKPISHYMKINGDDNWKEVQEIKMLIIPKEEHPFSIFFFSKDGIQLSASITDNHRNYKGKTILRATLSPLFSTRKDLSVSEFEKFILDSADGILKLFFGDLRFGDPIIHTANYVTKSYESII